MDTLLAQLKRQVRRDLEPLKVTLTPAKKKNKDGKKNDKKNSKKGKKQERKNKNNKNKGKRDPKEVELPEITDTEEDDHQIQRRDAEVEDEVTGRQNINGNNKEKKN